MEDSRKPNIVSRKVSLGILIVLAMVLILGVVAWHQNARENAWGKISFQEYTLDYLPDGLKVTSKTIDARYTPANEPAHTTILNLKLSKSSHIYEHKDVTHFAYSCAGSIINQACLIQTSPHNQRYTLTTTTIPGQPVEQTFKWLRGSTVIQATFRGESAQPYPQDVIGKIIDSLRSATYQNLKVNYYDNSRV
jgi:hypothetical protein